MQISWVLPITAALVWASATPSWSLSASQVAEISKAVTVAIQTETSIGSGVLVAKNARGYTVLTAAHVVKDPEQKHQLVAPDGKRYKIDQTQIKILPGADLALVQLVTTQSYRTIKIRQANAISEGSFVYVAGFPQGTQTITKSLFNFTEGRVTASSRQPLKDGYGLVYTNLTLPGMSGGSVLNDRGELVAIHGRGDIEKSSETSAINPTVRVKTGFNLGILANVFVPLASKSGLKMEVITAPDTAPDQDGGGLVSATVKLQSGDLPGALAELDRLITTSPKKAAAYYLRASVYQALGDNSRTLPDLNRAIELDVKNPRAYYLRGNLLYAKEDLKGALADFNRTVQLDSKYIQAYLLRAIIYQVQGDLPGALTAYTDMIKADPQNPLAYSNRAGVKAQLNDLPGAIEDFSQLIKLNPENISAYNNRGHFRRAYGDVMGAINDYSKIIELSPNNIRGYSKRAELYKDRKDWKLALADYTKILKINPNETDAYSSQLDIYQELGDNRGVLKALDGLVRIYPSIAAYLSNRAEVKVKLQDKVGAITDYRKAIQIYRQQGNTSQVEQLSQEIRNLGG
jgi:tetratricopeptide (TPR) repeat protein/V8-like Glu-specific endopeptidase